MAGKSGLTDRQKRFCVEYLKDQNGTMAAERAGYSKKSAAVLASRLLASPKVRAYKDELVRQAYEAIGITPELIALRIEEIYQRSMKMDRDNLALKALKQMGTGSIHKEQKLNVSIEVLKDE